MHIRIVAWYHGIQVLPTVEAHRLGWDQGDTGCHANIQLPAGSTHWNRRIADNGET